jgi:hypothetical protein
MLIWLPTTYHHAISNQQKTRLPIDKPPTNRYNAPHTASEPYGEPLASSKAMHNNTTCHTLQRQVLTPKQYARQLLSAARKIGYIEELTSR